MFGLPPEASTKGQEPVRLGHRCTRRVDHGDGRDDPLDPVDCYAHTASTSTRHRLRREDSLCLHNKELAERGAAPAVLGPILAALVLGGNSALTAVQLRDGEHESSYLSGVHQFSSAAGVLLLAAVVVAGIGVARWAAPLRHVARFGPEASVESKPEGG